MKILKIFFRIFFKAHFSEPTDSLPKTQSANLGNFVDGMNVPRCARPAKSARKYLFHRIPRRPRGRGYTRKTTTNTIRKKALDKKETLPTSTTMLFCFGWCAVCQDRHSANEKNDRDIHMNLNKIMIMIGD